MLLLQRHGVKTLYSGKKYYDLFTSKISEIQSINDFSSDGKLLLIYQEFKILIYSNKGLKLKEISLTIKKIKKIFFSKQNNLYLIVEDPETRIQNLYYYNFQTSKLNLIPLDDSKLSFIHFSRYDRKLRQEIVDNYPKNYLVSNDFNNYLLISPDRKWLCLDCWASTLVLIDLHTYQIKQAFNFSYNLNRDIVKFTPDSKYLVVHFNLAFRNESLMIIEVESGNKIAQIDTLYVEIVDFQFSYDNRKIYFLFHDNIVECYQLRKFEKFQRLKQIFVGNQTLPIHGLELDPKGLRLKNYQEHYFLQNNLLKTYDYELLNNHSPMISRYASLSLIVITRILGKLQLCYDVILVILQILSEDVIPERILRRLINYTQTANLFLTKKQYLNYLS